MSKLMKKHVPALVIWIVIVAISLVTMPNISQLVREKGAIKLPNNVESQQAAQIEKKANNNKSVRTYIAVFNAEKPITGDQSDQIKSKLKDLKSDHDLSVTTIMGPNDNEQTRKQLIAKDKTTQLAQITVKTNQPVTKQVEQLQKKIKISGLKSYVTGIDAINSDFNTVAEKGIQKTEVIAIIFIFIVLVIVFHSPIVPIISLLNVGVAFLTSLSIIMNLADKFDFPISNFTQVFLVVVLFGIGTDYNILLYNYFKQSLSEGLSAEESTRAALKHGGRTVLYSGISVLIGFSVLALAKFSFYQSAVGVAIGVLVLLAVLLTLNFFFMSTLGAKMFWPSKVKNGVKESKLWHGLSKVSIAQPVIILGVLLIAGLPGLFNTSMRLNFNNADEVPDSYPAKKGYVVIQDHFGKGMSAPATIYIESNKRLDNQASLAAIDELTEYLQKEPGVKSINSVTQPGGSKIKQLYLKDQLKTINKGIDTSEKGLKKIKSGLEGANNQLAAANIDESIGKVQQLADGTNQLQSGTEQLASGVDQYTSGAAQVDNGVQTLNSQLPTLAGGVNQLSTSTQQLAGGMGQLKQGVNSFVGQANKLLDASGSMNASEIKTQLNTLNSSVSQLKDGSTQLSGGIGQLQGNFPSLNTGVNQLSDSSKQLSGGMSQLKQGIDTFVTQMTQLLPQIEAQDAKQAAAIKEQLTKLQSSTAQLTQGSADLSNGIGQVQNKVPALSGGVDQLNTNSQKLAGGMAQLQEGVNTFSAQANQILASLGDQSPEKAQQIKNQINQLQSSVAQLAQGSNQLSGGVGQLNNKVPSLTNGVDQLGAGTSQLAANGAQLTSGAQSAASATSQVNAGVQTLNTQLKDLSTKVTQLQDGLKSAEDGLDQLIKGSDQMKDYLVPLQKSYIGDNFYIPKKMITSKDFKPSLDTYMSDDRKITHMLMIFEGDPNSEKVSQELVDLQKDLDSKIKHGDLKDAKVAIDGQTSQNNDLRNIANGDFIRTASIMIIGIGVALMVVTESVLQPMTIITTLLLTYISSLWLARVISKWVLGNAMLSWNTPFFSFIMLVALGVDYSIFLMIHFKDAKDIRDMKERMLDSAKVIGPVVISAAIILSGTFAALMPSGVTTLIQVALAVIIGLVILVIALPMSMSVLISLTEWHNKRMYQKNSND
ncbi:MMPL family transporter [Xylocopilactobacillus apicola]|uniref:Membrane protein n=1 Tax=Xylocopilactobacillus apicola TaxID=2932184 RepID=A0AAU9D996_9LACO|nr:MMPL family transporter [Xylocopilactobacillus apicola]BDR58925.1 membrane protein [Xylocopilactobacillus apicola]